MPKTPPWFCKDPSIFNAHTLNVLQTCEWEQWQIVVKALKECGAVTEQDGQSLLLERDTSGQLIYAAIREWGDLKSELDFMYAHRPK